MATVYFLPLMGFDVNGRRNPGDKPQMFRSLLTFGLKHRVLKTVHFFLSAVP